MTPPAPALTMAALYAILDDPLICIPISFPSILAQAPSGGLAPTASSQTTPRQPPPSQSGYPLPARLNHRLHHAQVGAIPCLRAKGECSAAAATMMRGAGKLPLCLSHTSRAYVALKRLYTASSPPPPKTTERRFISRELLLRKPRCTHNGGEAWCSLSHRSWA